MYLLVLGQIPKTGELPEVLYSEESISLSKSIIEDSFTSDVPWSLNIRTSRVFESSK